jgi:hypothetical protein
MRSLPDPERSRESHHVGARVGMIIQLRLSPEYGPNDGMDDRMPLIEALDDYLGNYAGTDSGSRSTNIKCWDILPEKWDEVFRFALGRLRSLGLLERATVVRLDYEDEDVEDGERVYGPEVVVWPENYEGEFKQWPEFPGF